MWGPFHTQQAAHTVATEPSSESEAAQAPWSSGPSPSGAHPRSCVLICFASGTTWPSLAQSFPDVAPGLPVPVSGCSHQTSDGFRDPDPDGGATHRLTVCSLHTSWQFMSFIIIMPHRENMTGSHYNKEIHLFLYLGPHLCNVLSK